MRAKVKNNFAIGDIVFAEMNSFRGYGKVSAVDVRPEGLYYILSVGSGKTRGTVEAYEAEVFEAAPVAMRDTNGEKTPVFFVVRGKIDERN